MPEFMMELGEDAKGWDELDQFTQGYIEGAFFTESGDEDRPCHGKTFSDLAPQTLKAMKDDCTQFNLDADQWLGKAYLHDKMKYDMHRAGVDFWLTRNRHGAGFWDRGLGQAGDELSRVAHMFGEVELYIGDDGLIYS